MADAEDTEELRGSEAGSAPLVLVVGVDGVFTSQSLPERGDLSIGRSRTADIVIDHASVSRLHARLKINGEAITITDAGSANGTQVRGQRVAAETPIPLTIGESFDVGAVVLVLRRMATSGRPRRVWSHGHFEARVEEEAARSLRSGRPFALLRLSFDQDPPAGTLEAVFAGALRTPDVLAIYARGELEVLLVEAFREEAEIVVGRLRMRMDAAGVRVRMGLACFPHDGTTGGDLLARAHASVRPVGRATTSSRAEDLGEGSAPSMQQLRRLMEQVAPASIAVLILGETGVGKEVCAETIHRLSPRAARTFLRLNCAALPEALLEGELFGHERGAFTGAVAAKAGLIESADGGTVFLDEIGELPLALQVKLLRVLDAKEVMRLGGRSAIHVDVRFIAATNRALEEEAKAGRFRQDLYFRLAGVTLAIPPLRRRVDEIVPLAEQFLAGAAEGREPPAISTEARQALLRYAWPGNIRELRNAMERALLLCGEGAVLPRHLPLDRMTTTLSPSALLDGEDEFEPPGTITGRITRVTHVELATDPAQTLPLSATSASLSAPPAPAPPSPSTSLRGEVEELERQRILDAMARCGGNQSAAARMLGMSRGTLIARLETYGVARPRRPPR